MKVAYICQNESEKQKNDNNETSQINFSHSLVAMFSPYALRILYIGPFLCHDNFRSYGISLLSREERESDDYFWDVGGIVSADN